MHPLHWLGSARLKVISRFAHATRAWLLRLSVSSLSSTTGMNLMKGSFLAALELYWMVSAGEFVCGRRGGLKMIEVAAGFPGAFTMTESTLKDPLFFRPKFSRVRVGPADVARTGFLLFTAKGSSVAPSQ